MALTEDKTEVGAGKPPPAWQKAAKRYAPFVVILLVIAGVVVAFGGGGDDDEPAGEGGQQAVATGDELIESGPMTPQKAELLGEDVDFGPRCDTETGRIMLPAVTAAPCVEPFTGDNGGATSPGVTADEIKIVYYQTDPALDPLAAATIEDAGADVDPDSAADAVQDYVDLYNEIYETYGRRVVVEHFTGSGAPDDAEAARADAIAIAEQEPFAVIGGPTQSSAVFGSELAANEIVCGPTCALSIPEDIAEEFYPYLWQTGPTPDQAAALTAEMVGNLAGPGPAALSSDPAMQDQERAYAVVHYDTPEGDHQPVFEALRDALADNGIELATDVEFNLDLARAQENARTVIARLQEAGVTTVIYYGDPFTPGPLTAEATAQDYHPEWILGPSVLADTTIFGRQFDPDQWQNGFGLSLNPARGERSTTDSFQIYEWAYGEPPSNNTVRVLEPPVRTMFTGLHLAGPDLTPETFRDGLYRYPVSGGGPTTPQVSRGRHGVWPGDGEDRGGTDDAGIIWWDPEATGADETGNDGTGMYRSANGGERYTIGNFPASLEEAGVYDVDASVTVYDEIPAEDQTADYDPPEGFG